MFSWRVHIKSDTRRSIVEVYLVLHHILKDVFVLIILLQNAFRELRIFYITLGDFFVPPYSCRRDILCSVRN